MVTLIPADAVQGAVASNPAGPWLERGTLFRIDVPFVPQVLIQVCILIASVAAVAFVGSSVLESEHHKDFYAPVLDHVKQVMQERDRYRYYGVNHESLAPNEASSTPRSDAPYGRHAQRDE